MTCIFKAIHYCLQMYLRTFETSVLKYMNSILLIFCLQLLSDIDMLLIAEKGTRGGICHSIHKYTKANNKYMKSYDKDKESSYLEYLDPNNLNGWAMSKTLPVNGFE